MTDVVALMVKQKRFKAKTTNAVALMVKQKRFKVVPFSQVDQSNTKEDHNFYCPCLGKTNLVRDQEKQHQEHKAMGSRATAKWGLESEETQLTGSFLLEANRIPVPEPIAPMKSANTVNAPMHIPPKAAAVATSRADDPETSIQVFENKAQADSINTI
nr:Os09g0347750 [Ipomoea batatas]